MFGFLAGAIEATLSIAMDPGGFIDDVARGYEENSRPRRELEALEASNRARQARIEAGRLDKLEGEST